MVALIGFGMVVAAWFFLGPKSPEKDIPHYAVHVVEIHEYGPDEMVSIANQGTEPLDLGGWTLWAHRPERSPGIAYHFPDQCVLNSLQMLRIHSGPEALYHSGTQCEGKTFDLYWTSDYVWCDTNGDSAYLYDAQGRLAEKFAYGAGWHLDVDIPCAASGEGK